MISSTTPSNPRNNYILSSLVNLSPSSKQSLQHIILTKTELYGIKARASIDCRFNLYFLLLHIGTLTKSTVKRSRDNMHMSSSCTYKDDNFNSCNYNRNNTVWTIFRMFESRTRKCKSHLPAPFPSILGTKRSRKYVHRIHRRYGRQGTLNDILVF